MIAPGRGTSADAVRLALVGCGRLARAGYLPALAATPRVELVAVADSDPGRAHGLALAARPGVRVHYSLATLLDAESVDAVVLATPAAAHLDDARLAATQSLPALVEKPPAPSAEEAYELACLDPAPRVAFNRRFDPRLSAARAAAAGAASPELRLELRYRRRSWRPYEVADDALLDLGPHVVDLASWLTGAGVVAVRAGGRSEGDARIDLELELERGRAVAACATDRPWRELVEVHEQGGALLSRRVDGGRGAIVRGVAARLAGRAGPHPLAASLAGQLEAFACVVRGEAEPTLATAADGVAAMEALEAARRSVARGGAREPVRRRAGAVALEHGPAAPAGRDA